MDDLRESLLRGLEQLAVPLAADAVERLLDYLSLLHKWNSAYNLTAVRDPAAMISRHLLDSLAVAPFVRGSYCADVGTGAGLPGIPLAIAMPERQFVLLDSNGKKIRFVTQAIAQLQLHNVTAQQCRVEEFRPPRLFDVVLSRAFASLAEMAQTCAHLLAPNGVMLAMKGVYPAQELRELPENFNVEACHTLQVPGEMGARHLVAIRARVK